MVGFSVSTTVSRKCPSYLNDSRFEFTKVNRSITIQIHALKYIVESLSFGSVCKSFFN